MLHTRTLRIQFLLFFSLIFSLSVFAQEGEESIRVSGQILEESSNAPLEFVAVSMFRESDSLLVGGSITDIDGQFSFDLEPGGYYLTAEFIGYEKKAVSGIQVEAGQENLDLGGIVVGESTTVLDEVEVVAERTQMEMKLDKRVYNIGKDISNAGGNASDILDNLPSVQVDIEGNVSLRGSEQVRILIDGKPSGLISGGTDALRQLNSEMIEKVEIITNPSARYEAEGEVGIINIVLKKEKQKGFNGSFGLTAGWPENFGANYGLNFRRKSLNFFSNFGIRYRDSPGGGSSYQESEENGQTYIFESEQDRSRGGLRGNLQVGSDWYITDKDILTGSVLFQSSNGQNDQVYTFRDFRDNGDIIQESERITDERENSYDFEGALSYRKTFDNEDRLWTFDAKYIHNDDTELADYTEVSDTSATALIQRSSNTEDEETFFFQTDYAHPIGEKSIFEIGSRYSRRRIDNDFDVDEQLENGDWVPVDGFNNYMIYRENILAAYMMFGSEIGKFSYQAGVRAEHSEITTELVETNDVNPRNYLNFFPSVHFTYEFNEENQIQWSYSRRISRPRFRHLLPFYGFGNNRNQYAGNPDLEPEFSNSAEIGYLNYNARGSFLASVYYRYRTNVVDRITIPNGSGGSLRIPVNLATQHAIGIEGNLSLDLFTWWRNNFNFNFYRSITDGSYEGVDYSADNPTWSARWNGRFKLPADFDLQLAVDYRAPRVTPQGSIKALSFMDVGVTRDILNGNGTLILSVRDLFNSRKYRSTTDVPGFYRESVFQWRSRQFLLTFTYRLNRKKKDQNLFGGEGGGEG
ncbi:MAG: TonB-dependent receptor [Bacteroidetes bacterium]|nr:TonB-dependent receptor [Bacteroidota bacterium]